MQFGAKCQKKRLLDNQIKTSLLSGIYESIRGFYILTLSAFGREEYHTPVYTLDLHTLYLNQYAIYFLCKKHKIRFGKGTVIVKCCFMTSTVM